MSKQRDVTISLSGDAALVLDALLSDTGRRATYSHDAAEQAAVWELEVALERQLVATFAPDYESTLKAARQRLAEAAAALPTSRDQAPDAPVQVRRPPELAVVVLRCKDIDLSRRFYEKLGLRFVAEKHGAGPRHYSTLLGQTVLELYPSADVASPIGIGLRVSDFEIALAALTTSVVRSTTDASGKSAVLKDPDGNRVEVTSSDS